MGSKNDGIKARRENPKLDKNPKFGIMQFFKEAGDSGNNFHQAHQNGSEKIFGIDCGTKICWKGQKSRKPTKKLEVPLCIWPGRVVDVHGCCTCSLTSHSSRCRDTCDLRMRTDMQRPVCRDACTPAMLRDIWMWKHASGHVDARVSQRMRPEACGTTHSRLCVTILLAGDFYLNPSPPAHFHSSITHKKTLKDVASERKRKKNKPRYHREEKFSPIEEFLQSLSGSSVQTILSKPFFSFGDQVEVLLILVQISQSFEADTLPGSPDIVHNQGELLSEF
ncbi:hypothetical protein IGI04_002428 [Brassica rapa subsp. trilocularis]|uniref:Uncharacterized protein n=1 Tax=Brassica rapa subsp. trilocularis TaxID=1813537 RepID=A0ABQ7NXN7_BRACM|nr:hypothetical protein IGI04_002428 [Brassica rapa subsp. trilocularis]